MLAGVRRLLCLVVLGALPAGCGGGGGQEPKPVQGSAKEVAAVVARLDAATRARRFSEVCDRLMDPTTRERAGGGDCARQLREAAAGVRRPRVALVSIRIAGPRAQARVRSSAAGQAPVKETLDLVRRGGEYRIASLSP
jgi:hypothetical protein